MLSSTEDCISGGVTDRLAYQCFPHFMTGLMTSMQVGDLLLERMRGLQQKHNIIGDVRGQGLMLGVEMVKDQASKEPAAAETAQVDIYTAACSAP